MENILKQGEPEQKEWAPLEPAFTWIPGGKSTRAAQHPIWAKAFPSDEDVNVILEIIQKDAVRKYVCVVEQDHRAGQ